MTLAGIMEGLGLGAARDARRLVAHLAGTELRVATSDAAIARALTKAHHVPVALQDGAEADAALALALPDGEAAIAALDALIASTRRDGHVVVVVASGLGQEGERARASGLFLRAGLADLRQDTRRGLPIMRGTVVR